MSLVFSVVIPSFNRRDALRACLQALSRQQYLETPLQSWSSTMEDQIPWRISTRALTASFFGGSTASHD